MKRSRQLICGGLWFGLVVLHDEQRRSVCAFTCGSEALSEHFRRIRRIYRATSCTTASQFSVLVLRRSSQKERDTSPDKQEKEVNVPALIVIGLLFAGPAVVAASWTTWFVAAGALSLAGLLYFFAALPLFIALSIAGTLLAIALAGVQIVGFSVLATSLALLSFLFKASIVAGGALLAYTLIKGEPPPFFNMFDDKSSVSSEEKNPALADWDTRFTKRQASEETKQTGASDNGSIRFEDLSPSSPVKTLRDFVKQEGLDIDIAPSGLKKVALYREIAVQLVNRKSRDLKSAR